MKVENIDQANKLVKELKQVEIYRDLVCSEKERIVRHQDTSTYMSIRVDNVSIDLDGHFDLSNEILDLLISEYTLKVTELTKQIEAL